jgi:hypothetical protein
VGRKQQILTWVESLSNKGTNSCKATEDSVSQPYEADMSFLIYTSREWVKSTLKVAGLGYQSKFWL